MGNVGQYLIVSIFQGGFGPRNGGLNALIVLFAGVALLFTARYPRDLFELAVGMNRWTMRVLAYALLMRDEYPPFRLSP